MLRLDEQPNPEKYDVGKCHCPLTTYRHQSTLMTIIDF